MHNVNQRLRDQQASLLLKGVAPLEVVLSAFHTGSKKKKKNRRRWSTRGFSVCIYIYAWCDIIILFVDYLVFFSLSISLYFSTPHTRAYDTCTDLHGPARCSLLQCGGRLTGLLLGLYRDTQIFRLINLLCSKRRTFFRSSLSTYIYNLFWTFSFRHFFPCPRRL